MAVLKSKLVSQVPKGQTLKAGLIYSKIHHDGVMKKWHRAVEDSLLSYQLDVKRFDYEAALYKEARKNLNRQIATQQKLIDDLTTSQTKGRAATAKFNAQQKQSADRANATAENSKSLAIARSKSQATRSRARAAEPVFTPDDLDATVRGQVSRIATGSIHNKSLPTAQSKFEALEEQNTGHPEMIGNINASDASNLDLANKIISTKMQEKGITEDQAQAELIQELGPGSKYAASIKRGASNSQTTKGEAGITTTTAPIQDYGVQRVGASTVAGPDFRAQIRDAKARLKEIKNQKLKAPTAPTAPDITRSAQRQYGEVFGGKDPRAIAPAGAVAPPQLSQSSDLITALVSKFGEQGATQILDQMSKGQTPDVASGATAAATPPITIDQQALTDTRQPGPTKQPSGLIPKAPYKKTDIDYHNEAMMTAAEDGGAWLSTPGKLERTLANTEEGVFIKQLWDRNKASSKPQPWERIVENLTVHYKEPRQQEKALGLIFALKFQDDKKVYAKPNTKETKATQADPVEPEEQDTTAIQL